MGEPVHTGGVGQKLDGLQQRGQAAMGQALPQGREDAASVGCTAMRGAVALGRCVCGAVALQSMGVQRARSGTQ